MSAPLAFFLTWTVYGSWLHGDPRGSADKDHNKIGTPYLPPDDDRRNCEQDLLKNDTYYLPTQARDIIEQTIADHCTIRQWTLHAVNARTNHIHVVVRCTSGVPPERAMDQFKAWATRRLRAAGLIPSDAKVWTRHGSTRWINTSSSLAEAIDYVLNQQ